MRPFSAVPGLVLLPAMIGTPPLLAGHRTQSPDADWITFTTAHYRIHCPLAFEAFGREVAGRVEGVHAQYLGLVGFVHEDPRRPIDILILDPVLQANGYALPFLSRPQVVLWKTEPEADSVIGHHRGWAELVLTHELGHMHHLMRPYRKPNLWQRWNDVLGPLPKKAPRWITEGYATVIEGKLTGSGRPHSTIRAAILRQWAIEGKLPTYEALSGLQEFLGGSMAYLGGSAYLEWLEAKSGDPKCLQTLWIRLAGKRKFEAAFTATFGFGPKDGYQRFCAELTHTALELERRLKAEGLREGELVTQLKGWTANLALSPDGSKLLAQVLDPKKPGLYVWDLKTPPHKPPVQDPDEPADHPPLSPMLPPARRLGRIHGALPWKPAWRSSNTIAYELRLPDEEGVLKPQYRLWSLGGSPSTTTAPTPSPAPSWKEVDGIWNLVDGQGRPLTRTTAAAWAPTASPDGKWIYYLQLSAAGPQIRKLDTLLPPLTPRPLPLDPAPLVANVVLPKADEPSPLPPPVPVEGHPYRVGESHRTFGLIGASDTPSGVEYQIGGGGNDMLGRLNWQVLAGVGNAAGPRGGTLGAAWRGWSWAPALQVFSSLERPSRQDFLATPGFDRERRGAELMLEHQDLGRPRFTLKPTVAFERISPVGGESFARSLVGGSAAMGNQWGYDDQGLQGSSLIKGYQGRTGGQTWNLTRVGLRAGWINPWLPVTLRAEAGRIGGDPTAFDRFHLGGVMTSLLPASLDANRVVQPALPAYTATGDQLRRLRGELGQGLVAYIEHTAVWDHTAPRPSAQRVAGIELDSQSLGLPMDIFRRMAGNLSFTFGLHRPLDGVMKGRTIGTISLILRP